MRPNLPSHAYQHLRDHRVARSARSGASGLLAGGLALLGLAAVPISGVVTDSLDEPARSDAAAASSPESPAAEARETSSPPTVADRSDETVPRTETEAATRVETAADDDAVEPAPPPEEPEPEPAAEEATEGPSAEATRWDRLADCESGEWDEHGQPIPGTARWDYGIDFAHEGYEQFEGGLNFEPGTWDAFRDDAMPDHAGNATREQQVAVAERVLASQGWGAWPVCSEMVGLR